MIQIVKLVIEIPLLDEGSSWVEGPGSVSLCFAEAEPELGRDFKHCLWALSKKYASYLALKLSQPGSGDTRL